MSNLSTIQIPDQVIIDTNSSLVITTDYISSLISVNEVITDINTGWYYDIKEFKNTMPDLHKVEEMCKEYPALEKAYENFKTIYQMVEQDWSGKQKERGTSSS